MNRFLEKRQVLCFLAFLCCGARIGLSQSPQPEHAIRIKFLDAQGKEKEIVSRIVAENAEGKLLVTERDGRYWTFEKSQIVERTDSPDEFKPLSLNEFGEQIKLETSSYFEIHTTEHYLILHGTSLEYAKWSGQLFERLRTGFERFFKQQGFELKKPEFPLAVILFPDKKSFSDYALKDVGGAAANSPGYYSATSNRIVLYDLTSESGMGAKSRAEIERRLNQATANVATIIHEASHQLAFNTGVQVRYADNPLWYSEGLAMYFESPDLKNRAGWSTVGQLNRGRLAQWRGFLPTRKPGDFVLLIEQDQRLIEEDLAVGGYPEAWGLSYFLWKKRPKQMIEYVKTISKKVPLQLVSGDQRRADFQDAFGEDPAVVEREFVKYLERLK